MTTFKRPLQKQGGKKLESIFQPGGFKAVGDVYRERLGGPPFPVTRDPPAKKIIACDLLGCHAWHYEGDAWQGQCSGFCI